MVLPRLGTQGGDFPEKGYRPPVVESIDSKLRVAAVADMNPELPEGLLQRGRKYVDPLPERAFVLGLVEVYGASPCKSGEITSTKVYFVGEPLFFDTPLVVHSMEWSSFSRIYQIYSV